MDFDGLPDLALMTSLHIPLDICFKGGPPKAVEESVARGIKSLVAQVVVGIANEREANGGAGVKLVAAAMLPPPQLSFYDQETTRPINKTSERIGR